MNNRWIIEYDDLGGRYSVTVECNKVQLGRVVRFFPNGKYFRLVSTRPAPEAATIAAVLETKVALARIAEASKP